jgi:hypothetical protein
VARTGERGAGLRAVRHGLRRWRVIPLTDGRSVEPDNDIWHPQVQARYSAMSMMQLVIGATLGFLLAQALVFGARQLVDWAGQPQMRAWLADMVPAQRFAAFGGFPKYAALVLGSAAIITLGLWGVVNYLASKAEHTAAVAAALDPVPAPAAAAIDETANAGNMSAAATPASASAETQLPDPYADPDFKVHRHVHRPGSVQSLKEVLLQREESKARAALLKETNSRAQRSQYDCEAAVHLGKYLKADLDVWGFSTWQAKYFPMDGYKGASIDACKDVKNVLDPTHLNLQAAVAQRK